MKTSEFAERKIGKLWKEVAVAEASGDVAKSAWLRGVIHGLDVMRIRALSQGD